MYDNFEVFAGEFAQFVECWEGLEDARSGNAGLHDFHELLTIGLCCVLWGGQGPTDMAVFARAKEPFPARLSDSGQRASQPRYVQSVVSRSRSGAVLGFVSAIYGPVLGATPGRGRYRRQGVAPFV